MRSVSQEEENELALFDINRAKVWALKKTNLSIPGQDNALKESS